ncbi:electron transfer flavoprotein subunit alpha/FixB family protein [Bacteroidota bacterium]
MANKILAFVEAKENKFKNSAFEVVSVAKKLAGDLGCEFDVLTISSNNDDEIKKLGAYGAKKVILVDSEELNSKNPNSNSIYSNTAFAKAISEVSKLKGANIVLISATAMGKDLAPRVAIKTDSAISPDCIDVIVNDGKITARRPVYAGKSIIDVKFISDNVVLTLRPNVFKPEKLNGEDVEIEKIDTGSLNINEGDFKINIKEVVVSNEKLDVSEADKIVSGGRGLREASNFHLIEELANVLGAATGASRAVVDAEWRSHSEQVGQTGKTVSPNLYIACGISGAIQHLAGMSSSKCIVAINKDKDAPIFQIADYGIVGDLFEILPALTEEFKKVLSN